MTTRRLLVRSGQLCFVGLLAAVLVGQVLDQPVLLSYVETGSMAPTLQPGDGFVAIPVALVGSVGPGDVVTYRAERLQGGGLTTHRVVAVTDAGYVTKGDANAVTDQESVEPPVQAEQIVARALAVDGTVVVVPGIGHAVAAVQTVLVSVRTALGLGAHASLVVLLAVAGIALYFVGTAQAAHRRVPSRPAEHPLDGGALVLALAALLVIVVTATMVLPAGPTQFGIVSANTDAPGPRVIEAGTTETANYSLSNPGLVPTVSFLHSRDDALAVSHDRLTLAGDTTTNATVTITAPPETGYYRYYLVEDRYLGVLPTPMLVSLWDVHPWLPIIVIDALVAGFVLVVGQFVVDSGMVTGRIRSVPLRIRIRRWIR